MTFNLELELLPTFIKDCEENREIDFTFSTQHDFRALNYLFEVGSLEHVLCWSLSTFGDRIAQVTSFGATGMVILDHLAKLQPGIKVITIDTGFLFPETYNLWETVQRRYPICLEVHQADLTPTEQAQQYGPTLWKADSDQCCYLRKVIPLADALAGLGGWFTGLRRDQSSTRANIPFIQWDASYELVKINPLANWTRQQVWQYIVENQVPYNPLHDQGYTSIGCTYCTRTAINPTDERSGRWQGKEKTECGIHLQPVTLI